jgi:UPF0716 protein FxsA
MLFLLLLILWPVAEVLVAIKVAEAFGVFVMLVALIASWPIGTWALRSQGRAAWRRFGDAVAASRAPGREAIDGALVLIGGILLITPGFITDVLGAMLLLPPSRALLRRPLLRNLQSRFVIGATRFGRRPAAYDVDSTATEVEPPRLRP